MMRTSSHATLIMQRWTSCRSRLFDLETFHWLFVRILQGSDSLIRCILVYRIRKKLTSLPFNESFWLGQTSRWFLHGLASSWGSSVWISAGREWSEKIRLGHAKFSLIMDYDNMRLLECWPIAIVVSITLVYAPLHPAGRPKRKGYFTA